MHLSFRYAHRNDSNFNRMPKLQSIVIAFLLLLLCAHVAMTQSLTDLKIKRLQGSKEVVFKHNTAVRILKANGEIIRARINGVIDQTLVFVDDTARVDVNDIIHLRRTTVLRPVASAFTMVGSAMVVFGTAGWASSVGSDDVWASLGAVVGALIAVGGAILDAISIPVLLKTRNFKLSGDKAKWAIVH